MDNKEENEINIFYLLFAVISIIIAIIVRLGSFAGWISIIFIVVGPIHTILYLFSVYKYAKHDDQPIANLLFLFMVITFSLFYIFMVDSGGAPGTQSAFFRTVKDPDLLSKYSFISSMSFMINIFLIVCGFILSDNKISSENISTSSYNNVNNIFYIIFILSILIFVLLIIYLIIYKQDIIINLLIVGISICSGIFSKCKNKFVIIPSIVVGVLLLILKEVLIVKVLGFILIIFCILLLYNKSE